MPGQSYSISLEAEGTTKRRYGFALTPLADAMFQLLIFFMLSSSLSPYSLMSLTRGVAPGVSEIVGPSPANSDPANPNSRMVIWHLSHGELRAGDQTIPIAQIRHLMPELTKQEINEVLVFPSRSATVQDVASVLEQLGTHGVLKVRIVAGSTVGGG